MSGGALLLVLLSSALAPAQAQAPAPSAQSAPRRIAFTDVTAESGLDAHMTSGALPSQQILEVKGGGLALIDYDHDGDFDIFMPNGATLEQPSKGPGARLFRNDSKPGSPRFTDVTEASGIRHAGWSFGAAVGDVDADGHDDIFIACFGPDVLLRNRGDGTFEDISERSGIADPSRKDEWGTSAAFADLDGDGDLDLFVVNYLAFDPASPPPPTLFKGIQVMSGPKGFAGQVDRLFLNRGDGTFVDATEASGIASAKRAYGLNLAILDFTGDGHPDIFVANDSQPDQFFRFDEIAESAIGRVPKFSEIGMSAGIATNMEGLEQASMGIAIADVDGNGQPDKFTTNFSSDTNTLHLNLDGKYFDDRTNQFGLGAVSRPYLGWGAGFFDFDHDGDEDLLIVNGHVYPQASKKTMDSEYEQRPLLFERDGARFAPVDEAGAWKLEPHRDRTAIFSDLDRDGDIDVVVAELNGSLRLLRNDHASGAATDAADWLIVRPRDRRSGVGNRDAIGSVITARSKDADGGERVQRRWIWGGGPFQSTSPTEAHFGFPPGTSDVRLELRWPDGTVETRSAELGHYVEFDRNG